MTDTAVDRLDLRLPALRATDVFLAALQAAFSLPNLAGSQGNPFLFVRDDPKASQVWVCDPEGRIEHTERGGKRDMITVSRGDYIPSELHRHNYAGGSFSEGLTDYTDLVTTMILIQCEAGSKVRSEVLASVCYNVLKLFRRDLMADYDLTNYHLRAISAPVSQEDTPGSPWLTTVTLQLETQEHAQMTELANHLNRVLIQEAVAENQKRVIAQLDSPPE